MRQVPRYLIIGNGRVARHFLYYFSCLTLSVSTWHRKRPISELQTKLKEVTHVLVLISDDGIQPFFEKYSTNNDLIWLHFSGSLVGQRVIGAHPLMTFNHTIYDIEHYKKIPFVIDDDAPDFNTILPGLPNPHVILPKKQKAKYHALCVLSANFSCILWQKLFTDFENEFNFKATIAHPYLLQQTQNLLSDYTSALTGPLVRNDSATIEKNIKALDNDIFQTIYQDFVTCYQNLKELPV